MRPERLGSLRSLVRGARWLLPLAVAVAVVGSAQATPSTKYYGASVSPAAAAAGEQAPFTLTLTNDSSSTQTLGSANFTAPSGWTLSPLSATATSSDGHTWTVCVGTTNGCENNVVQFRAATNGDALAPGDSVEATVTANVPCSATGPSAAWTTQAKQSNSFNGPPGNDFLLATSPSSLSVRVTGPCSLQWVVQPTSTKVNTLVTGAPYDPTGGTLGTCTSGSTPCYVAVEAVDGEGNLLTMLDSGTVLLNEVAGSTGATTDFTGTTATFQNGVAAFDGTQLDTHGRPVNNLQTPYTGTGFELRASSPGFTPTPDSGPFNITLTGEPCSSSTCPTFSTTLGDSSSVDAGASGGSFVFLGISPTSIPDQVTAAGGGCAYYTPAGGAFEEIDGRSTSSGGDLTFTYYLSKNSVDKLYGKSSGQQFVPLCAGAVKLNADGTPQTCTPGDTTGGWTSKELSSDGKFDGNVTTAVCYDGLYWGILGSFQDYTNSDPSKIIDPTTNPTVTGWGSTTNSRYFTVDVPPGWDWKMG